MSSDPTPASSPVAPDTGPVAPEVVEPSTPSMAGAGGVSDALPAARRVRQLVSVALIVAGAILLIITLRAQDLGLASTAGASRTQVTLGILGTVLLVTGLALIVQAFEDSSEPPDNG